MRKADIPPTVAELKSAAALFGALADSMVDGPNTQFHAQRIARTFEGQCLEMLEGGKAPRPR